MILGYPIALAVALFAIGLAGVIASRHLLVIMLGIELMLVSSTVAAVSFFSFSSAGSDIMIVLLGIWAIAIADTIAFVTFYTYIKSRGMDLDISKMSRLKW
ncbi:MAG: NADH-quinone oxidoreductase subunit K [Candidatus Micrarchaeia archaeon]